MRTVAVLAGNLQQFENWCREIVSEARRQKLKKYTYRRCNVTLEVDDTRYVYMSRVEKLRGLRIDGVFRVGTWYNNREYSKPEFEALLMSRRRF